MAHYAEIGEEFEPNKRRILRVIVVANSDEPTEAAGEAFCNALLGGTWKKASYNATIRANFASLDGWYDLVNDVFILPQPYPSWVLDENFHWQPPIPRPGDNYYWDEDEQQWVEM